VCERLSWAALLYHDAIGDRQREVIVAI